MRRILPAAFFLLALVLGWWFWPRNAKPSRDPAAAENGASITKSGQRPSSASTRTATSARSLEEDFPIVAPLNRPDSTIARDLDTLNQVFDAWRSNFPRQGNPVGENAEITAALAGDNSLGLALLPKNHAAINARGELCDRWGTPFRFHQLSGEKMEIRSAGPDRKFATEDDALWRPPE